MCLHYQFPPSQRFHSPCFFPAFGPNDCVILTPSFFILRVDLGIKMSQREYHRMCERIAHSNSWLGNWGWIPLRSFKSRSVPLFQIHPYPHHHVECLSLSMDEARNREVLLAILMCVTGREREWPNGKGWDASHGKCVLSRSSHGHSAKWT